MRALGTPGPIVGFVVGAVFASSASVLALSRSGPFTITVLVALVTVMLFAWRWGLLLSRLRD